MHCVRGQRSHGTKSMREALLSTCVANLVPRLFTRCSPSRWKKDRDSGWSRDLVKSRFSTSIVVLIYRGVTRCCGEFVNLTDGLIPSTRKPNSEYFSSQNNHVSCRNLMRVLSMLNNFKELLNSSTSFLVVYSIVVAFAKAVGDVKL